MIRVINGNSPGGVSLLPLALLIKNKWPLVIVKLSFVQELAVATVFSVTTTTVKPPEFVLVQATSLS